VSRDKSLTYSRYLKLDELLALQSVRSAESGDPRDGEHDELLFIVIHQVFELWFKQLLHELDRACALLGAARVASAQQTLKRVLTILKVIVRQIDVLETMTPLNFNAFRDRLESASGLQSFQFRELEFVLGLKRPDVLDRYPESGASRAKLRERLAAPTLWDAFLKLLSARGYAVPAAMLNRDVTEPIRSDAGVRAALEAVYASNTELTVVCELLVDLDEGLQEWRYRHLKMVQRTIGTKPGTGRTAGVGYLATTLNTPLYPDLWDVRAQF
jgi:tryptophan 2,3-dioxygenase